MLLSLSKKRSFTVWWRVEWSPCQRSLLSCQCRTHTRKSSNLWDTNYEGRFIGAILVRQLPKCCSSCGSRGTRSLQIFYRTCFSTVGREKIVFLRRKLKNMPHEHFSDLSSIHYGFWDSEHLVSQNNFFLSFGYLRDTARAFTRELDYFLPL